MELKSQNQFIKSSINAFPINKEILKQYKIPIGITINPFAEKNSQEKIENSEITFINPTNNIIQQCSKCGAFLNTSLFDRNFECECPLCKSKNTALKKVYIQNSIEKEKEKEENSIYESYLPDKFTQEKPQSPSYFFIIDCCAFSIRNSIPQLLLNTLKELIQNDELFGGERARIGFITFDSTVHFYNFSVVGQNPEIFVVPDFFDIGLPAQKKNLLVNLHQYKDTIISFLDSLSNNLGKNLPVLENSLQNPNEFFSDLPSALEAMFKILEHSGGKAFVFQTTLPSFGKYGITKREKIDLLGTENEKILFNLNETNGKFYEEFANKSCIKKISIDLFLFSTNYIDITTLGILSNQTKGNIHYYPNMDSKLSSIQTTFPNDLKQSFHNIVGWNCKLCVLSSYFKFVNHFSSNDTYLNLLKIPQISSNQAFTFELDFKPDTQEKLIPGVQVVVMYTNHEGENMMRIIQLKFPIKTSLVELFQSIDSEALINLWIHKGIKNASLKKISEIRDSFITNCSKIIQNYFSVLNSIQPIEKTKIRENLINYLPDSLKLLPILSLSLTKNILFSPGRISIDERSFEFYKLLYSPIQQISLFIFPQIFSLKEYLLNEAENAYQISNTKKSLKSDNIYIFCNGQKFVIWIGKNLSTEIIQSLFNVPNFDNIDKETNLIDSHLEINDKMFKIINQIQSQLNKILSIEIVKEGNVPQKKIIDSWLVEDRLSITMNFQEFLYEIYQNIPISSTTSSDFLKK
ncbi:sec24-related protein [Anaeramoeba ignava]|uniref:Sec24-related protein n=1 Tax=Anaeramoeba ignava TaxID=1746090 RepID=A0A9Q0L873_ANAIG|nr:sec24-related protein [Anaeramoeba ignava]